jgi:integrase/recombinase XerD
LEIFLESLQAERNSSQNTVEAYMRDLQDFEAFLRRDHSSLHSGPYSDQTNANLWEGPKEQEQEREQGPGAKQDLDHQTNTQEAPKKSVLEVTEGDIYAYRMSLETAKMKQTTIARKIVAIRQLFGFLFQEKIIAVNPARNISLPKQTRPLPRTVEKEEIFAILEKARSDMSAEGKRKWLLFELLYGAGLRVSELVSLELNNFSVNPGNKSIEPMLLIKGKGGKERIVPMHETCVEALVGYLLIRPEFVKSKSSRWLFPSQASAGHLTRQRAAQLLKETAAAAGVNTAKLSPHTIRHAFATHLLAGGANLLVIQRLLGHADISTTQIYTHVQSQHLADLIRLYHPLSSLE